MDEKSINVITFTGVKERMHMWYVKLMKRSGIKEYDNLLLVDQNIPAKEANKIKYEGVNALKMINKKNYNQMIMGQ